jgi:hypothetical protein
MREYATPGAFRSTVEAKLRQRARHLGPRIHPPSSGWARALDGAFDGGCSGSMGPEGSVLPHLTPGMLKPRDVRDS